MNSDGGPDAETRVPACLIGHRVIVVAGEGDADGLAEIKRGRIAFSVGDRSFNALWSLVDLEPGDLPAPLALHDGLLAFASAAGLPREDWGAFCAPLLGVVAKTFALGGDSRFGGHVAAVLNEPSLPRGRLPAETVAGIDTMILHLPRSFGLAPGDLLVAAEPYVSAGVVKAVREWSGGGRIAAVGFSSRSPDGTCLAVSPRGLAVIDLDVDSHAGTAAFHERHVRVAPELVSLLSIADDAAAVELGVLGRRAATSGTVADATIRFHFELTDVLPMPHGLFVHGWFLDPDRRLDTLTAVDYGLRETSVMRGWHLAPATLESEDGPLRVTRFTAFLPRRRGETAPGNTAFRLRLAGGEQHLLLPRAGAQDDRARRDRILHSIAGHDCPPEVFRRIHMRALAPVQAAINRRQGIRRTLSLGGPASPATSIVVPIYRETRFIRSQLMAFACDAHIRGTCEIVYVLDDPLIALDVERELVGHAALFPLAIRLLILDRNGGYALANNFGVAEARGETLVLMNSDVVPEAPGWLEILQDRLAALPPCSVVGPKLLHADGGLQHAGMYFQQQPNGRWQNMHYYKGYGRDFGPANVERDVPALTGALMVLRRADYRAAGGFDAAYAIGDYEDSDLCLKLRARGGRCRYVPEVALMHFERQSMPGEAGAGPSGATLHNEALHDLRWSPAIAALMAEFTGARHAG